LVGMPCISIPCGFTESEDSEHEKLPVWLQLIWPQFADQKVLEIANVYETQTEFSKITPEWYED
jgi:Asp-tRNA(Asn)/Glu-tRNA(Gln) amidotransferase A subunit family amidase